jgi:hypothetical protein
LVAGVISPLTLPPRDRRPIPEDWATYRQALGDLPEAMWPEISRK